MTAIERIRQAAQDNYNNRVKEVAQATGKTLEQAKILIEIEESIKIEHERLIVKQ